MLLQLDINNIALIEKVSVEFGQGLNVMTGETGAGKSIMIDSINAVLGERVSKDLIRTGSEKGFVEAVFAVDNERFRDLFEEYGIEPEADGTVVISREFNMAGRNICRINGKMATVSMLKIIGERLIDIHGQHDNQSLLRTESHLDLLDSFGGTAVLQLKEQYSSLLAEYKEVKTRLRNVTGEHGERERKIDLIKYQIDEIKKAKLKKGEEEELNKQKVLLSSSEKISGSLASAYELLYSGGNSGKSAVDALNGALSEIGSITRFSPDFDEIYKKLQDVSYQLEDAVDDVRKQRDSAEYDPDRLEQIEERLDLIYKLKRKYGSSVEDVLSFCSRRETELSELHSSEEIAAGLTENLKELGGRLYDAAVKIDIERRNAAAILEESIGQELDDLEMKKARFKVDIVFDESCDSYGEHRFQQGGLNKVEFLISPNAGEPLKPLARIASGGEMSRIMLAIKKILADVDMIPTLIFDEIDIGISGKAAQKVGEKLSYISGGHQVICVTHLAQIACMADNHYLIEKLSDNESTRTFINKLNGSQVEHEISRILGGDGVSGTSVKYARELLDNARNFKSGLSFE